MNPIFRLVAAAILGLGSLQGQPLAPVVVKVAFWNVEWFPGGRPDATEEEVARQIALVPPAVANLNADVLGLEEIRDWSAAEIALGKGPDLKVQICSDFLDEAGAKTTQQVIIGSRLPAIGAWWESWKAGALITPKRGFSFAAFQAAPGSVLLVYCVHLKSNRGNLNENISMREESVRQLLDHVAAMEKAYAALGRVSVVVGGDFNTSNDDVKFEAETTLATLEKSGFRSCWKGIPLAQRVTIPSSPSHNPKLPPFPDACFDYAFVKGAKIISAAVKIPDPNPSDHRPVVVGIELPAPRAP